MSTDIQTTIVNLFAGPGAGKSTTAAGVFHLLKKAGIECEYIPEFAKDLTWEGRHYALGVQPYIFGKQMKNLVKVIGKVKYAITDSPILLSYIYAGEEYPQSFKDSVVDIFKTMNNRNFFIRRGETYSELGRNQTREESEKIDEEVLDLLVRNEITVTMVDKLDGAQKIVDYLTTGV